MRAGPHAAVLDLMDELFACYTEPPEPWFVSTYRLRQFSISLSAYTYSWLLQISYRAIAINFSLLLIYSICFNKTRVYYWQLIVYNNIQKTLRYSF